MTGAYAIAPPKVERRFRGILAFVGLSVALAFSTSPCAADGELEEARVLYERATEDYQAGHFEAALRGFEQAYALTDSPDLLYNVGRTLERLRRDREALDAYERYVELRPDGADRGAVDARIAVLRREIDATTDSSDPEPSPAVASPPLEPPPTEPPPPAGGPRMEGVVFTLVGGALLIAGAVLFAVGASDFLAVENAPRPSRWEDYAPLQERAPILTGIGIPLFLVGVAATTAGLVWAFDGADAEVALGPGGVSFRGRM